MESGKKILFHLATSRLHDFPDFHPPDLTDFLMMAMEQPDLKKRLADGAVEIVTSASPAEFGKFIARETQRWEKVIKEINVGAD